MNTSHGIDLKIDWSPHSFEDPGGRLFRKEGSIFRALRGKSAEAFRILQGKQLLEKLPEWGVVETWQTDMNLPDYDVIVGHRKVSPSPLVNEWSPRMLYDAATLFCELSLHLAEHGLQLQDSHGWNIMFEATRPVYVDFASIVPLSEDAPWMPLNEFINCFLHPLRMIHNHAEDYAFFLLARDNWVSLDKTIPRFNRLQFRISESIQSRKYRRWSQIGSQGGPQAARRLSETLLREISKYDVPDRDTRWSNYVAPLSSAAFEDTHSWHQKQTTVKEIITRLDGGTLLDLGCNTGWYSVLAARMGHSVVSMDTDRSCINELYQFSKEHRLAITPVVGSLFTPTISNGPRFWEPLEKRFPADHTFMLALAHHLFFKQGYDVETIVRKVAEVTLKSLVLEYVPIDDYWIQQWGVPHRIDEYHLDHWADELKKHFTRLEFLPSEYSHPSSEVQRTVIFAQR